MADSSRIEDLRRRVQKDPASIAFAQLAEECRRAGECQEAIDVCRTGLAIHPGYLSARVTLGRALIELDQLDDALAELEHVLEHAPENLAAIRGLAEIHHRRGNLSQALSYYRAALALAKNDPDLQETVNDVSRKVEPPKPLASAEGLSLEQVTRELSIHFSPPPVEAPLFDTPLADAPLADAPALDTVQADAPALHTLHVDVSALDAPTTGVAAAVPEAAAPLSAIFDGLTPAPAPPPFAALDAPPAVDLEAPDVASSEVPTDLRAVQTIAALEQWLDALHVARTHRGA